MNEKQLMKCTYLKEDDVSVWEVSSHVSMECATFNNCFQNFSFKLLHDCKTVDVLFVFLCVVYLVVMKIPKQ